MKNKWTYVALGALIGTAVSVTLAWPGLIPRAIADEQPMKLLTASKQELLDMFDGHAEFFKPNWTVEETVATEVISSKTVRKIEAGRTSFVTVATTPSGVYSSDGLSSPHVRYPGIHAEQRGGEMLAVLTGGNWAMIMPVVAGSFAHVVPTENGGSVVTGNGNCHFVNGSMFC
ncbi:MAG: hypothetical protein EOP19_24355 [Hyphomicrobiales bacterium]|nr:MAG: hypothetical protein EOP19_24355 [Hyphomicrobiales bacterium]